MPPSPTQQPTWRDLEDELQSLAERFPAIRLDTLQRGNIEIETFFCRPVMELARFLRKATGAQELGSQHHTLKILFKYLKYGDRGKLEHPIGGDRADIYLPSQHLIIEVKTITEMTLHKLFNRVMGVIHTKSPLPDYLWVFYFYKLRENSPTAPECAYLLTFICINLMVYDTSSLLGDLTEMVEESKRRAAERLEIPHEFIIPLENLLKVEDLERELGEKDRALSEKDRALSEKDRALIEKDQALSEKDQEIAKLNALLKKSENEKK